MCAVRSPADPTATLLARAFRDYPAPLVVTSGAQAPAESCIVFANPAFARAIAQAERDIVGQTYGALLGLQEYTLGPGIEGREGAVRLPDAPERPWTEASIRVVPLYGDAAEVSLHVVVHGAPESAVAPPSPDDSRAHLLQTIPTGVLVHRDFRPLYANAAATRVLGLDSPAEVLAQPTLLRFVPLDRLETALDRHDRLRLGDAAESPRIARGVTAAGVAFWAEITERLIDWDGAPAVAMTLVDAGARVHSRRSEALLHEAIDNLSDSFILYDAEDRVVLTNRRFHEAFPFLPPQDKIAGTPMIDLVRTSVDRGAVTDPALRADNHEAWIAAFIEGRRNKLSLTEDAWPNGRWDLVKEQRLDSGGFVSVRTDITERKRAEFALKEQESQLTEALAERTKQLEAVLANIAQGVIVLNPSLEVVLTNQGLHDLIGYPPKLGRPGTPVAELIRNRLRHGLYLPGERESGADLEAMVERRLEVYRKLTHEVYQTEFPNGRFVEIRREKLPDGMIVCTFTDVSDRVEAERELTRQREALYQREKLSALGMLLAGIAHELNNPLSVVLGQATMMESQLSDEVLQRRTARIRSAAERCAKIVKTFLAMARDEPASRAAVQINELVEQAHDLVAYQLTRNDIEVARELAPDLPAVYGDPDQLNQVVVNLLVNAMQAMEETQPPRRLTLRTGYLSANGEVELEVSDSGPGVPEDLRGRIFDPFFTTKPAGVGTGVGLSVCHGMVTAHGGTITVDAAPTGGARFLVRLPCAERESSARVAQRAGERAAGRGRVLIIDDEPEIRDLMVEFLGVTGLEVEVAAGGAEARARLVGRDYDAVVCDLRMPDLDGPALFDILGRERPELLSRFIFATGDLLSDSTRRFVRESGRPCLEKPLMPEQVRRLVLQVVERGA